MNEKKVITIYECGICGAFHYVEWNGDCRDDENRFNSLEDFADYVEEVEQP